jgi:3-deoxy-D-manno-octulosonic-acid transferase
LYNIAANIIGPPAVLAASLKGRFGGRWRDRLGLSFSPPRAWDRPRLWFHGASVGEARSAAAIIRAVLALRPWSEIYLSVGTPAGLAQAEEMFRADPRVRIMAPPLDFWGAPGRALARLNPDALIILETELWPGLVQAARRNQVALILAAGRLSERSFRRYRLAGGFMAEILSSFALIAPAGDLEKELFAALGAPPERLKVLGNPKFDPLLTEARSPRFAALKLEWARKIWGGGPRSPLIVAGSTHPGEEAWLLSAFSALADRFPDLRLLLAPRHLTRIGEIRAQVRARGLEPVLTGEAEEPLAKNGSILILDSMGQLPAVYAQADLALVGGTLLPELLGHNPLEPAAVGAPILFGPYRPSFRLEAAELLAAGGARATSRETLAEDLAGLLAEPATARLMAQKAGDCLARRPAAAPALAEAVFDIIGS